MPWALDYLKVVNQIRETNTMVKVLLMNFGGNTRVIHDASKTPVIINIGKSEPADLDVHTYDFILKSMAKDTLLMIKADAKLPPQLHQLMAVLTKVETEHYDTLLSECTDIIGKDAEVLRPTRAMIRQKLQDVAFAYAHGPAAADKLAGAILEAGKRVFIQEEERPGDLEDQKEHMKPSQKPAPERAPAPRSIPDPMIPPHNDARGDDALDLALGNVQEHPAKTQKRAKPSKPAKPTKAAKGSGKAVKRTQIDKLPPPARPKALARPRL